MAKRFTDTEKWNKVWFKRLTPTLKSFWTYICDRCNHAGIWEVDFETAEFYIGEKLNPKLIQETFKKQFIELADGKRWFIEDFIEFQYGQLNRENRVHLSVIDKLKKEKVWDYYQKMMKGTVPRQGETEVEAGQDLDTARAIIDYFNETCRTKLRVSAERLKIVKTRLREGKTADQLKKAVLNFSHDDWSDRRKYMDLVYAIGQRNKVDNFEKWFNLEAKAKEGDVYGRLVRKADMDSATKAG